MSSVAFDKIVPFGQDFILDDMPVTLTLKERAKSICHFLHTLLVLVHKINYIYIAFILAII